MRKIILIPIALLYLGVACNESQPNQSEEKSESQDSMTIVNGVERSELALLMRKMYDEMVLVKDSIKAGHQVKTKFLEEFKRIHSAHATEPEKIDEVYHSMADAFLVNYEMFESTHEGQTKAFNNMLQQCLTCHEHKCPGPVKAIKKLRIKPEDPSES